MKKYTIKDLSEGRVAVINDGSLDELMEVLGLAFPDDYATDLYGVFKYYFKCNRLQWEFDMDDTTNLPTQSVNEFLK